LCDILISTFHISAVRDDLAQAPWGQFQENNVQGKGHVVDRKNLPGDYPTHLLPAEFWEQLGRTVATFGLLEETLGKAIFSLTATRRYPDEQVEAAYEKWLPTLRSAISDPLGRLIDQYAKALKDHGAVGLENPGDLIGDLRSAARLRNVICHGSWGGPDADGGSLPFFVTPKMMVFETHIDLGFLRQTRAHVVELICSVIDSVTHLGWQFPGSSGPGAVIFRRDGS
jgi:hypothetical protein